jgi:hypothetical protein
LSRVSPRLGGRGSHVRGHLRFVQFEVPGASGQAEDHLSHDQAVLHVVHVKGPGGFKEFVVPEVAAPGEDEHDATTFMDVTRENRLKKLRTTADEAVIPAAEYAARLRAQHVKLNPKTAWAKLPWQRKKLFRRT